MLSSTASSSASPIAKLPYDVLQEIFTQCLPQYPLQQKQPNTTIAPILLCHICSSWRTLALTSPTLWTHLSYHLYVVNGWDHASQRVGVEVIERDIEFIWWWRGNQGQIAPFLRLDVSKRLTPKLSKNGMAVLLEYLTSARYLELDMFYWKLICEKIQAGYLMVFLNLNTVLINYQWIKNHPFHQVRTLLPPSAFPALRRLYISDVAPPNNFFTPTLWSTLTHFCLNILIPLDIWCSWIRAVPHLQWGYFKISTFVSSSIEINNTPPVLKFTLLEINTLFITVGAESQSHKRVLPLSFLFTGLCMLALRTLSLCIPGKTAWEDQCALCELYTVLKLTPAITTLTLDYKSLSLDASIPEISDTEPIWTHAKELAHLWLALPRPPRYKLDDKALTIFMHHIFSPGSIWLDLQNPISPIRMVTINTEFPISDLTMLSIREIAATVPKVVLELTSRTREQGITNIREEWGSGT